MSKGNNGVIDIIINWLFLAYFIILGAERIQSLVRSFAAKQAFHDGFGCYVTVVSILSLVCAAVLLAFYNGGFWKGLFGNASETDYSMLCITAGVILLSGMVHTEYTVPIIQFISYGMLIVAMILKTVMAPADMGNTVLRWLSLIYLTAFSMAIPVVYRSGIDNAVLFHVIEAVVSVVLVAIFTLMLREIFMGRGADLFCLVPIVIAVIGDAAVLLMRWKEEVNSFVLIFIICASVLWVIGKIASAIISR